MNNDVNVTGGGTLNLSGGISGSHALDVLSGNLTATSISVGTLDIGSSTITETLAGGPQGGDLTAVPEPCALVLLAVCALFAAGYAWRRRS